MELTLYRTNLEENYTIGKLYIDSEYFCDTLEDTVRDYNMDGDLDDEGENKIPGKTAIPYGTYKVILTYSPKFKTVLPYLLNVKEFEGIRIHWGQDEYATRGCILIGKNLKKGKLFETKNTVDTLIDKMKESNQEEWLLTIT